MITRIFWVAIIFAALSPSDAAESWWRVLGKLEDGPYGGGRHDDEGGKAEPALKEFLATDHFDEWETFEDEAVKLVYPKHPLLKLEVNGGKEGIKVEGGVCTSVDNSFQRAYVLKAGGATYGVFLLTNANWLDDGICMCGPMVHHVYRMEDGCLARFSLLPGGAVKKAQLLGDKVRLMAFEWTHLACKRPIYEEMVERMTLRIPSLWSEYRLRVEVSRRYGMEGRAGWLAQGLTISKADEIMEKPSKASGTIQSWSDLQDNYPAKVEALNPRKFCRRHQKRIPVAYGAISLLGESAKPSVISRTKCESFAWPSQVRTMAFSFERKTPREGLIQRFS